ncbi:MAG: aminotransferase class I/II-fold pyridoxal phosphate-dependent enzyme, partial [Ruthenibacterium sp.]
MKMNRNYAKLESSYLFSTIAKKVAAFTAAHPEKEIIRLGIGDVTLPLTEPVVSALHTAADEMAKQETFRGYGPEQGYPFLREAIADYYA